MDIIGNSVAGGAVLSSKIAAKFSKSAPAFLRSFKKIKVNVSDLVKNPKDEFDFYRGNYNRDALRSAREYIKDHGTIKQPIDVRILEDGTFQIIDGHHRWWAAKQMGLKTVPVKVVE
ncbi:ParB/RepB/Spo0J family partition protein [Paenibacillus aceti]|uniref:ParB/RepB/Spo0J family partition protein n=1 Tax=Paenibacillus aceti TaxID=1820010 RepID=UPI000EA3E0D0|nr:ParB/RepB/Spo0J family partition protein [Paenibacillus aceti]